MAAFMQLLPKGFAGKPRRSTENTVFNVVEGAGRAAIGGKVFEFGPRDIFVVPSWSDCAFSANEQCVIFSFSDRPAQEAAGFLREEDL